MSWQCNAECIRVLTRRVKEIWKQRSERERREEEKLRIAMQRFDEAINSIVKKDRHV